MTSADDFCLINASASSLRQVIDGADACSQQLACRPALPRLVLADCTIVMEMTCSEVPQGQWT